MDRINLAFYKGVAEYLQYKGFNIEQIAKFINEMEPYITRRVIECYHEIDLNSISSALKDVSNFKLN